MLEKKERRAVFSDLLTEYLYVLIPFVLLFMVKGYMGVWVEIILSPDWSLASCIIFGQITTKVSKAIAAPGLKASPEFFGLYTAKRFFLVVIALLFYFGMLVKPTQGLGWAQLILFAVAARFHFTDGVATYLLLRRK